MALYLTYFSWDFRFILWAVRRKIGVGTRTNDLWSVETEISRRRWHLDWALKEKWCVINKNRVQDGEFWGWGSVDYKAWRHKIIYPVKKKLPLKGWNHSLTICWLYPYICPFKILSVSCTLILNSGHDSLGRSGKWN